MKYMVVETHRSYCVVLDEEGRFIKAANKGYETGQIVEEIIRMKDYKKIRAIPTKAIALAASAVACLVLVFTLLLNPSPVVHASVYLSINPQVRADVSQDNTVISLIPLNAEADTLLEGYDWKRKPLTTVTHELVDRAIDLGFLSQGGKVTINIDSNDEVWFQETGITLRQDLSRHIDERLSVTIEILHYIEDAGSGLPGDDDEPGSSIEPGSSLQPEPTQAPSAPVQQQPSQYITKEDALQAALNHAGVIASNIKEIEIELEENDGIQVYEIEFETENVEYEYEINARTGEVVKFEIDADDDDDDGDDND